VGSFNIKLLSRIKELGLRSYEVAYTCHMHESDLSRIINGRRKPNEKQKKRLCELLKSSPEELNL